MGAQLRSECKARPSASCLILRARPSPTSGLADGYAHVSGPAFIAEEPSARGLASGNSHYRLSRTEAYTPSTAFRHVLQRSCSNFISTPPTPTRTKPTVAAAAIQSEYSFCSGYSRYHACAQPIRRRLIPDVVVYCASETVGVTIHDFVVARWPPAKQRLPGSDRDFPWHVQRLRRYRRPFRRPGHRAEPLHRRVATDYLYRQLFDLRGSLQRSSGSRWSRALRQWLR